MDSKTDMPSNPPSPLIVPLLSAANFVIGMGAFVIIGILNPLADAFALSAATTGLLMVVYAVAYAVLSPLLVSLTGGIGRRRVLASAMLIFAAAAILSALATNATVLFAGRVVAAIGAGLVTPVAAAVAAGLSPPAKQGTALANVFLGLSLAQVAGVPLGSFVAYTYGWRVAFWIVAALALPCAALIWIRVPAGLSFVPLSLADLGRVLRNLRLMLAVSFTSVFLSGTYIVFTFIAPLLSERMGFGRDGITLTLTLAGLGAVAGSFLGGRLADRIGATRTLAGLSVSLALIMPAFSMLPMPVWAVMVMVVLWNLCGWSFMAAQQLRLISLSPADSGVLLALNAGAVYVGAAGGSAVGGAVLNTLGLDALGFAGACVALLSLVVLLIAPAPPRQR
ncbi:MFS transporter [Seohaeicola saemankumensis]|nr:MFS transporter [Seohaeicola saemankumensis]MCA0870265.1 MFS transporter [Seohaeicola saemankumensis]